MTKFNEKTEGIKTTNHMGAPAYKYTPKFEFVSLLLTSFVEEQYYRGASETLDKLKELIKTIPDKEFVAKALIYARHEFGMRSISHAGIVELVQTVKGETWTKKAVEDVIRRVDDITEILAYQLAQYKKPIPNSLKKGLAKAFGKFDEYQLAKYRGEKKELKLIDAVNILHPTPTETNKEALKKLVNGTLKSVDTWESKLTQAGQKAETEEEKEELKASAWAELIKTCKIGYFALLRNLRNILEQAPELTDNVCELLTDKTLIKKSLVLPFRYFAAYTEIEKLKTTSGIKFEKESVDTNKVLNAIEQAIRVSVDNLPELHGNTVILSDNSGSMTGDRRSSTISRFSNVKTSDIANLFAVLYWLKANNTYVGLFGDRLIEPTLNREVGVFENFKIIDKAKDSCGPGTEQGIFEFLEKAIAEKTHIDTIVVFSDCQIGTGCQWYDRKGRRGNQFNTLFEDYRKINPHFKCYSVDLKGYGTTVFNQNVFKLAGWSEKIFDIMKIMEQDKNALIKTIENYEVTNGKKV